MKVSGFTMIRNGTKFDYPYLESLRSLLPVVDELVIAVGKGEDDTLERLQAFARDEGGGKVVLFETVWDLSDPEKRKGGRILAEQTNLALDRCSGDWCIYLQADEVFHEDDRPRLRAALELADKTPGIEGLLFNYTHFYGSFDVIHESRSTYRREVRAVRRSAGARSVGDAQSFRKPDGSKLRVIHSGARVFHYGWVRTPDAMREKTYFMDQLYHGTPKPEDAESHTPHTGQAYRYKRFWGLKRFKGTHPATMRERIARKGWHWDLANSELSWQWQDSKRIMLDFVERLTGHRFFEYRSYRLVASPKRES